MRLLRTNLFVYPLLFFFTLTTWGSTTNDPAKDKFVIVLDAGHGGKDTGNRGNGYLEKRIALNLVLQVGKALEKHDDIKVIYTRTTDEFVTLKGRAEKANKAKADLFVSVHLNAFRSGSPYGTETYVLGIHRNQDNLDIAKKENSVIYLEEDYEETYDGFDPESPTSYISMELMQEEYLDQSILLADNIQKEFTNNLKRFNRGVKKAGFLVLRETYMPSVLVEAGFLTNASEGRYLNSKKGQREIASSIAQGLIKYKEALNFNTGLEYGVPVGDGGNKVIDDSIVFRIQVAAGSKPLKTAPYNFKGLDGVERKKEGDLYKYYYGKTSDYLKVQDIQREVQEKGFKNPYIVAFKDEKKLDVNKALEGRME